MNIAAKIGRSLLLVFSGAMALLMNVSCNNQEHKYGAPRNTVQEEQATKYGVPSVNTDTTKPKPFDSTNVPKYGAPEK